MLIIIKGKFNVPGANGHGADMNDKDNDERSPTIVSWIF